MVRLTLEAVYVLAHFLAPIMPYSATAIFKKLGNPPQPIPTLQASLVNLKTGALLTCLLTYLCWLPLSMECSEGLLMM